MVRVEDMTFSRENAPERPRPEDSEDQGVVHRVLGWLLIK